MKPLRIAASASPYAVGLGAVLLIAMMLTTMSLTSFERQWIVFLCGVLAAAAFASLSHSASSRWIIARRTAQLKALRARLATESHLRARAEEMLARVSSTVQFVDEAMPAMLAYVDAGMVVRYHNQSFAQMVGLKDGAIDGHALEEIVGRSVYAEIEKHVGNALAGQEVRYERLQAMASGETARLSIQYLPHFGEKGEVAGIFAILADITTAKDLAPRVLDQGEADAHANVAARVIAALEHDEFSLYSQSIAPLGKSGDQAQIREVLLRLKEEEENHLPPGSFLPIAEEHGLLPDIDRWVVRHVLDAAAGSGKSVVYFLNVSSATLAAGSFAEFVRAELARRKLDGDVLCFEFPEQDVMANPRGYRDLISELGWNGCRFAISGFGRNPASVPFFKQLRVNYLKLDGGIILNVLRKPAELAVVKAINQAAHAAGMRTVAECVENEATHAALQGIETDFVQGFGISVPQPMSAGAVSPVPCSTPTFLKEAA
jgi:PAS domain S-box-containing protein